MNPTVEYINGQAIGKWRLDERKSTEPICQAGEHILVWTDKRGIYAKPNEGEILRCTRCGLDCT